MKLEKIHQQREEKLKDRGPKGPPVPDIMDNAEKSELFGLLLQEHNKTGLLKKLDENQELTEGDQDTLESYREQFVRISESVENFKQVINPGLFDKMARLSNEFSKIGGLIGGKGTYEAFIAMLPRLAIRTPGVFMNLFAHTETLQKSEQEYAKRWDEELKEIAKRGGLSEANVARMQEIEDPEERRKQIEALLTERMGRIKRLLLGDRKFQERVRSLDRRQDIENEMDSIDRTIASFGDAIVGLRKNSPDFRNAISAVVRREKAPAKEEVLGFTESRTAMPSKKTLEDEWSKWKKDVADREKGKQWTDFSPDTQETYRKEFMDQQIQKRLGEKKGVWSMLLRAFIEGLVKVLS